MSKSNKQQVPKIRFKEFSENWEKFRLNEICSHFQSGKGITAKNIFKVGEYPVYGGNGLRGYTHEFTHEGQYVLIGRQGALCGNIHIVEGESYISEHAVAVQANSYNDTRWLGYWLHNKNLGRLSESSAQPGLAVNKLVRLKIVAPCGEEQNKIGILIYQLDKLIELQIRAVESAETYKKVMLQKMFPQKGEKVPKVRFEGFSGDWNRSKLEDFGKASSGTALESEFISDGKYKVISIGSYSLQSKYIDQGIRVNKIEKIANRILNKNDLTMVLNDKTSTGEIIGRVLLIDQDDTYTFNQRTQRIEVNKLLFSPIFLYQMMNSFFYRLKIIKLAQGNTQIYVNWTTICKIDYLLPSIEEQTQIGNFFQKLDQNIESGKKKLEQYQTMKRAMLQRMFV